MKKKNSRKREKKKFNIKNKENDNKKGGERVRVIPEILSCRKKKKKKTNKQTNKQRRLTIERESGVKDEEKKEKAILDSWLEKKKNSKEDNKSENDNKEERGKKREGHT